MSSKRRADKEKEPLIPQTGTPHTGDITNYGRHEHLDRWRPNSGVLPPSPGNASLQSADALPWDNSINSTNSALLASSPLRAH